MANWCTMQGSANTKAFPGKSSTKSARNRPSAWNTNIATPTTTTTKSQDDNVVVVVVVVVVLVADHNDTTTTMTTTGTTSTTSTTTTKTTTALPNSQIWPNSSNPNKDVA